jgi:hypothetical protein
LKPGVHPGDHAMIYTGKEPPPLLEGEALYKRPIRMEPDNPRTKLDTASRINYAKLYTVEHNVKVAFVGWVAKKHEQRIKTDYDSIHTLLDGSAGHTETGSGSNSSYYVPDPPASSSTVQPSNSVAYAYAVPGAGSSDAYYGYGNSTEQAQQAQGVDSGQAQGQVEGHEGTDDLYDA